MIDETTFWPELPEEEEEDTGIYFESDGINFTLSEPEHKATWLIRVIEAESSALGEIQFVFCSDVYLLSINKTYLQHDTFTDIITFPYNFNPLSGEIYISVERVAENADQYQVSFEEELSRVMVHGVLHLLGYEDHTESLKQKMRSKEDEYLGLR